MTPVHRLLVRRASTPRMSGCTTARAVSRNHLVGQGNSATPGFN